MATLGPYMPMPLSHHCFLKLNHTLAISTGGYTDTDTGKMITDKTLFYQIDKDEWSIGPDLNMPRIKHSCGVLRLNVTVEVLIVAGGDTTTDDASSEYLIFSNFHVNDSWQSGPRLPKKLEAPSMVSSSDGQSLVLIGGTTITGEKSSMLFKLQCSNLLLTIESCTWQQMLQRIEIPRSGNHFRPLKT